MEKNERILILFFSLTFILIGCNPTKELIKNKNKISSKHDEFINAISSLPNTECGMPFVDKKSIANTISRNRFYFRCLQRSISKKKYSDYMNTLTPMLPYDNVTYYSYLDYIEPLGDQNSFVNAINLLVVDYQPQEDPYSDFGHLPFNEMVWDKLIYPRITHIEGVKIDEYAKRLEKKNEYLIPFFYTPKEFYKKIKTLWKAGKISITTNID